MKSGVVCAEEGSARERWGQRDWVPPSLQQLFLCGGIAANLSAERNPYRIDLNNGDVHAVVAGTKFASIDRETLLFAFVETYLSLDL
ncbi:MAG: hypothetical protein A2664_03535 [Candidatus Taylorbacteria bacterium RIFCSPHIGHO2_01_FULL_46_22b]|uniref:Uncharacterized protein n=1 Tax=Candidatus Taylorbacteria bacterium RIFCSPHIGHO2_01_FULL_46_22b TaxID=1802301 RepID=A0A1G2M1M4_9BACT|nr:MAG: hypothetical protein A2664_03535 [Candidatus Taylorbacteria bacterium RIFCSPHIGHO2_01_FULL_46_22b]